MALIKNIRAFMKNLPVILTGFIKKPVVLGILALIVMAYGLDLYYRVFMVPIPHFSRVDRSTNGREVFRTQVPNPVRIADGEKGLFTYEAVFRYNGFMSSSLRIIPDDAVVDMNVNGRPVNLAKIWGGRLNDWGYGFVIDLKPYLVKGENSLVIRIKNYGGIGGLQIWLPLETWEGVGLIVLSLLYFLFFSFLLYLYLRSRGVAFPIRIIAATALLVHLVFLGITEHRWYSHDVANPTGHLDYIHYITENLSLPNPSTGWEYHQPPLYYITAAAVEKSASILGVFNTNKLLQFLSLIFYAVFCYFGFRILALFFEGRLLVLATALLLFWPSGFVHAIRIGNDIMYYALFLAGLYYTVSWFQKTRRDGTGGPDFIKASVIAGLALITKATAAALFGIMGILMIVIWIPSRRKLELVLKWKVVFIAGLLGLAVSYGDNLYSYMSGQGRDLFLANVEASMSEQVRVPYNVIHYLQFDFLDFLTVPFTDPWNDRGGRRYFWNYLSKTMLFGEFKYPYLPQVIAAYVLSALFIPLSMLFLLGTGLTLARRERILNHLPFILGWLIPLLLLIAWRTRYPYSCNGDFRYMYTALVSFVFFVVYAVRWLRERSPRFIGLSFAAEGLVWVFAVCSLLI